MTDQEIKDLAKKALTMAESNGVTVLYPTVRIGYFHACKYTSARAGVVSKLWDLNGTFKTVPGMPTYNLVCLCFPDLDDKPGGLVATQLDPHEQLVFVPPAHKAAGHETFLCFWADDNPYPGTPDRQLISDDA